MPKQMCFYCFYGFICDFLEFPAVKSLSSKIFTAYCIQQDMNFKHKKSRSCKGSCFDFFHIYVFRRSKRTGLIDFPEKPAPMEVKYLLPIYQILQNFTKGNRRKFTVSFAFYAHADVINYPKTLMFSFEHAQII